MARRALVPARVSAALLLCGGTGDDPPTERTVVTGSSTATGSAGVAGGRLLGPPRRPGRRRDPPGRPARRDRARGAGRGRSSRSCRRTPGRSPCPAPRLRRRGVAGGPPGAPGAEPRRDPAGLRLRPGGHELPPRHHRPGLGGRPGPASPGRSRPGPSASWVRPSPGPTAAGGGGVRLAREPQRLRRRRARRVPDLVPGTARHRRRGGGDRHQGGHPAGLAAPGRGQVSGPARPCAGRCRRPTGSRPRGGARSPGPSLGRTAGAAAQRFGRWPWHR